MTFSFFIRTAVIAAILTSHQHTKPSYHFIKKMGFSTGLAVGSTAGITVGSSVTYYIHTGKNKTDSENTKSTRRSNNTISGKYNWIRWENRRHWN